MPVSSIGGEFLVNTATTGRQMSPSVAATSDGHFVIVWIDENTSGDDTSSSSVRGQLFGADRLPIGGEFLVNSTTAGYQSNPSIMALANGGFVVTWEDPTLDNSDPDNITANPDIRARLFDSAAQALAPDFRINASTAGSQYEPSIAALDNGFVVVWHDENPAADDLSFSAVRGQVFDNTGASTVGEFLIPTNVTNDQRRPVVAALDGGGFVVVWEDESHAGADTNGTAIRAQRYDANGSADGTEFLVNSTTNSFQLGPVVTGLVGGGFVVAWTDQSEIGTAGEELRGRLFDASGTAVDLQFTINSAPGGEPSLPSITALNSGGFVVTWADFFGDVSLAGVRGQAYTAAGVPDGAEFLVNTTTANYQDDPSVTALGPSGFLVAWVDYSEGSVGDAGLANIKAQAFEAGTPLANTNPEITGGATASFAINENTTPVTTVAATDSDTPAQTITYSKVGGEDAALFTINATTGELAFAVAPDFETPNDGLTPGYQVTIRASDGAGGTDQQDITVFVDDVAEAPTGVGFDSKSLQVIYVFGNEAGAPATFAGSTQVVTASAAPNTLEVTDIPDAEAIGNGPYGLASVDFGATSIRIEYAVDAGAFPDNHPDLVSGSLNFAAPTQNQYNGILITDSTNTLPDILGVTITAQDGFRFPLASGNISFTSDSIFINVNDFSSGPPGTNGREVDVDPDVTGRQASFYTLEIDFNDAPVIDFNGGGATASTTVDENTTTIATVTATDADTVDTKTFNIVGGEEEGLFDIDAVSGALTLVSPFDFENLPDEGGAAGYQVEVQVADGHGGLDTQLITVTVTNVSGLIVGDDNANDLNGTSEEDVLIGGLGSDTLTGGLGPDTFVRDGYDISAVQSDTITDFSNAEGDKIDLGAQGPASFAALQTYLLGTDGGNAKLTGLWNGNQQTLTLVGVAAASLTASNFIFYPFGARTITGTIGADLIFGGLDGDTLSGGGGDDTLIGDAGADTLDGGAGRDFLYFDSGDTLIGGADQDYAIADDPNSLGVSMVFGAGSGIETVIGGGGGDVLNASAVTTNITLIGGAGIDTLTGGSGSDSLLGQAGADILDGGGGNDFLYFASGDTLIGGTGFDRAIADDPTAAGVNVTLGAGSSIETVVGGAGADILNASAVTTDITLIGGDGIDTLTGGSGNDSLLGQAGADILDGGAGNDFLHFGTGDTLTGGADSDYAVALDPTNAGVSISLGAGSGIEVLSGALGGDLLDASAVTTSIVIFGSDGNDELRLGAGGGYAYGSAGNDTLVGGPGVSYLYFGNGDTLMGGGASDYGIADDPTNAGVTMTLGAGSGIETVIGVGGDDVLNASAVTTNITLIGGAGIDTLTGGSGNDSLLGQAGADILDGGAGNDFLYFGTGDTLTGGADNDYAIALDPGNAGVSMILGAGSGIEVLSGAAGADILDASALATSLVIYGSDGADTLTGGLGADTLSGGGEADNFVFKTAIGAGNIDTIADFSVADDTIWLDNAIMTGLGADGPLAVDAFVIGSAAGDASDRIVYYSATGALFYDADGDGAAAQVQFATLTAGLGMTNADFLII